jgi:hypothetical protein
MRICLSRSSRDLSGEECIEGLGTFMMACRLDMNRNMGMIGDADTCLL